MSTVQTSSHIRPLLSPQEAIARELIIDRVQRRHVHRLERRPGRGHARAAAALRRLAERLDPQPVTWPAPRRDGSPTRPSGIRPAGAC